MLVFGRAFFQPAETSPQSGYSPRSPAQTGDGRSTPRGRYTIKISHLQSSLPNPLTISVDNASDVNLISKQLASRLGFEAASTTDSQLQLANRAQEGKLDAHMMLPVTLAGLSRYIAAYVTDQDLRCSLLLGHPFVQVVQSALVHGRNSDDTAESDLNYDTGDAGAASPSYRLSDWERHDRQCTSSLGKLSMTDLEVGIQAILEGLCQMVVSDEAALEGPTADPFVTSGLGDKETETLLGHSTSVASKAKGRIRGTVSGLRKKTI